MKKPSKIIVVTAKKAFLLAPSFRAITLFGVVYCNKKEDVELINNSTTVDSILKCHETIHVRQAENTKNSWCLYYLNYIWQWICNLPLLFEGAKMPYKFIPYELEAYANETDYSYAYSACNYWRKFKKLSLKQKMNFARRHNSSFKRFRDFINETIIPEMNGEV